MKTLLLLEDDDVINPTDWIRPLTITLDSGESINGFSMYGGSPQNNVRWVQFKDVFGECHYGKTVRQIKEMANQYVHAQNRSMRYEIVRGDLPGDHIWNWKAAKVRGY